MAKKVEAQGTLTLQPEFGPRPRRTNASRRRRRNKANKGRTGKKAGPGGRLVKMNGLLRNHQALKRPRKPPLPSGSTQTNVLDEVSEAGKQYLAAVVTPFSSEATGAVLPSNFKKDVLPAFDRLSTTFKVDKFSLTPNSTDPGEGIIGIVMCILPRSRKSGFCFGKSIFPAATTENPKYVTNLPLFMTDDKLTPPRAYPAPFGGDAYNIMVFGLDNLGRPRIIATNTATPAVAYDALGAYLLRTTRFSLMVQNADSIRLLGAGIRAGSTASVLNLGGYCFGGSIKCQELHDNMVSAVAGLVNLDEFFQTNLDEQARNRGTLGSMVRLQYDSATCGKEARQISLDTSVEQVFAITPGPHRRGLPGDRRIVISYDSDEDSKMADLTHVRTTKRHVVDMIQTIGGSFATEVQEPLADPADQDLFSASSMVPIIYWKYADVTETSQYDIVFDSVFHSELIPKSISPFVATEVEKDLFTKFIQEEVINDPEQFPAAHTANSFKSLIGHLRGISGAVRRGAGKFEKAMSLFG